MLKTNEFETATSERITSKKRFSSEANTHYKYSSVDDLLKNTDDLIKIIRHHNEYQRKRLWQLREYYLGNNTTILKGKRRREEHLADNRATHNFAKYVSQFIQGYMVGVPLKTTYSDDDDINKMLRDMNRDNDADEHNSDLVLDQSIYGRAYELIYRNKDDEVKFTKLDVLNTFVIYNDTVECSPIAGVRYIKNPFQNDTTKVYVYTENRIVTYKLDDSFNLTEVKKGEEHSFEGVPIIEYENNTFRQGDYEDVLNLIDLYDSAESDTSNYMQDLNDAMLVIKGNLDIDEKQAKKMKEINILMLQTEPDAEGRQSQADADYIYKKYDVGGTEAYKSRLENDIHKFTNTPNMNDDKFAGNQSGEALKYKLFGLEQVRANKERLFKKSLRDRYRLINNIMKVASEGEFNVNDIDITFTPNLPKSLKDEIEAFTSLGGDLSDETKLSLLSFIENPAEELERMKKENPRMRIDYDFPEEVEDDEETLEET